MSLTFGDVAMTYAAGGEPFLVAFARMFDISFRFRPAHIGPAIGQPTMGLEVELVGSHSRIGMHAREGCGHCLQVLLVLLDLADWALKGQHGNVLVENINVQCGKSIQQSDGSNSPPVVLAVAVNRRAGLWQGANEWIPQTASEMRTALLELTCREDCLNCVS